MSLRPSRKNCGRVGQKEALDLILREGWSEDKPHNLICGRVGQQKSSEIRLVLSDFYAGHRRRAVKLPRLTTSVTYLWKQLPCRFLPLSIMDSIPFPILLGLALVVVIWAYLFLRKTGVIGGCLATIGTGSCLGHPFFHVSFVTLDRLLLLVAGTLFLAARNLFGLRPKPLYRMDIAITALAGWLAFNVLTHDPGTYLSKSAPTLVFFYLIPICLYWMVSRCELNRSSFQWVIGFFCLLGLYLAGTAVLEVAGIHGLVLPRYIVSPEFGEFLGRARGPYLNPIGNGMYLSAGIIATALWWPYVHKTYRPALLLAVGLMGVGALCTLTRSVWLGVACVFFVSAICVVPSQHRKRVAVALTIAGVLGLGVAKGHLTRFKRDKNVSAADMEKSAQLRPILAAFAFEVFQDYPVTGIGLTQYSGRSVEYLTTREFDLPMERAKGYVQHNVLLSLLTETGIVGVTLFLAMMATWVHVGWLVWNNRRLQLWQRQCGLFLLLILAAYAPNAMFHEMSLIPMQNTLIFFLAGLARSQQTADPPLFA